MRVGEDRPLLEVVIDVERQPIVPISKSEFALRATAIILDALAVSCFAMAADYNTQTESLGISSTALWVVGGISATFGLLLTGRWVRKDCCKGCRNE